MRRPSFSPGPRYPTELVRFALSNDALKTNGPAISRIARAILCTCSSLSMTHGPAIRTSALPGPNAPYSIATRVLRLPRFRARLPLLIGRADEGPEQRVRFERLGFELGVELAAEEPRVVRDLADLHVHAVRGLAGDAQPVLGQDGLELAVELVPVAVPLADLFRAVGLPREAALRQHAGPRAQP